MKMPPVITCDNCGLTYYQTTAPHVCAEWTKGAEEKAMSERRYYLRAGYQTNWTEVTKEQFIKADEPVARGGEGERWELGPLVHHGGIEQREVRRAGVDPFNGGHVCTAAAADAERIVTEHNQHRSLLAERERLREALRLVVTRYDISRDLHWRQLGLPRPQGDDNDTIRTVRAALNDQKGEWGVRESELIKMVVIAISDKDRDANQLDQWANESERGGWSTHQVEPMRKQADQLRREASELRRSVNNWHREHREVVR